MSDRIDRQKWEERLRALGMKGKLPGVLTETVLAAVSTHPQGEPYALADGKVPGLSLWVGSAGKATFWLHYRTRAGMRRKQKIAVAGAVTLDAARELAQGILVDVARGADPAAEHKAARAKASAGKTVRTYLENVYEPEKLRHRKAKNGAIAKAHILASWKLLLDVRLDELTRGAIEKVLADRKALKKADGSRQVKDGTLLRDWSALRAMLADALDRGHLAAMPLARRPEPIRGLRDEPRVRWLGENDTDEEIAKDEGERARFFKALDKFKSSEPGGGDFLRCVVMLAINTGMRRGEIVRLRDSMIKRQPDRLELPGAICKSGKGRNVFLNTGALAALKRWIEVRKTLKLQSIAGELFPGEGKADDVGERWEDRITQREFPRLCEQAGITGLTVHSLRHTFAALLVKAGVPMIEVRDACGHASIVTTEKHYAHLAPSAVQRSVQALRVR